MISENIITCSRSFFCFFCFIFLMFTVSTCTISYLSGYCEKLMEYSKITENTIIANWIIYNNYESIMITRRTVNTENIL